MGEKDSPFIILWGDIDSISLSLWLTTANQTREPAITHISWPCYGSGISKHGSRPELHWKHGKNDTSAKNIHSCPNDQLASTRGAHTGKWTFHVFDREPWAGAALHVFGPTNGQWWKAISMDKSGLQASGHVTYQQQQRHILKEDMTKPMRGILWGNVRDGHWRYGCLWSLRNHDRISPCSWEHKDIKLMSWAAASSSVSFSSSTSTWHSFSM